MDRESAADPVILALPTEIDITNCDSVAAALADSIDNAPLVIADMTGTAFCDSAGMQVLLAAHQRAVARACGLRVAVRPGDSVARVLAIIGLDRILDVYASVENATQPEFAAVQLTD
ncbi:MAG TPA: STAS domain-containing protein [Streptosporangiaceae bacterium]|jgi:anti-anti-sigma factor